jgi:predicted chitinase
MIDRRKFFDVVRKKIVKRPLKFPEVVNLENFLDTWERDYSKWDRRWLAYALATAWHETAFTMLPIEEYGKGKGRKYGEKDSQTKQTYYGRGYVQLTWKYNYEKAGIKLGVDLVNKPELALDPDIAAQIMFEGMEGGWFTGKKFADYFNKTTTDWFNARRIINGTDKAAAIGAYAQAFYEGVRNG